MVNKIRYELIPIPVSMNDTYFFHKNVMVDMDKIRNSKINKKIMLEREVKRNTGYFDLDEDEFDIDKLWDKIKDKI